MIGAVRHEHHSHPESNLIIYDSNPLNIVAVLGSSQIYYLMGTETNSTVPAGRFLLMRASHAVALKREKVWQALAPTANRSNPLA